MNTVDSYVRSKQVLLLDKMLSGYIIILP